MTDISARRVELEQKLKEAELEYRKAENVRNNTKHQLERLQRECKHENAVIQHGWQGGGIYYCNCSCPDCGRRGSRYIPQYHMHMNNEWYKNPQHRITLEQAVEIGRKIGDRLFDSQYWWGEVEDYDKLTKDTSKGWV
jgi:hypothetical protein